MILSMIIALAFPRKSCSYENIALLKPTWQATTYLNHSGLGPEKAVDGLKFNRSWFGHQCSISTTGQTTATWWVDLQDILSIHHIIIYYRTDNVPWDSDNHFTTRFLGFSVFVSNTRNKEDGTLCFHDNEYNITTIADVVNITCTVHGQYVIYHNERLLTKEYPQDYSETAFNELCEVEVYENIAYKHPTWQKTTHPSNFGPEKAVDGLKSDFSANGHQCSISANNQR
ncbi:uncharacterized protein LOC133177971, partial [Saccostrea echinata]|uniref:uncharacterized protein LOC133177971 n=1 Tax=Saccostrea echinata TaxID=191078 RepID=UPI002A836030